MKRRMCHPVPARMSSISLGEISPLVGEVRLVVRCVRVEAFGHDPTALSGQAMEAAEQSAGTRTTTEEAEVVAEHHDRVDRPETLVHVVDRERPSLSDALPLARLDGARR